jgi:hypothetical protein
MQDVGKGGNVLLLLRLPSLKVVAEHDYSALPSRTIVISRVVRSTVA